MSGSPRRPLPHPAARRLLKAGSAFAHCRAYWGRGTCECAAHSQQLHLPIDISASEEGLVMSLMDLDAQIEAEAKHVQSASHHWLCSLELFTFYGKRIRGGRPILLRMAWDAEKREAEADTRVKSLRIKREDLTASAPCLAD